MRKEPRGIDLLKTLIDLLAEQEGVKITYEIEESTECGTTYHLHEKAESGKHAGG